MRDKSTRIEVKLKLKPIYICELVQWEVENEWTGDESALCTEKGGRSG